MDTLVGLLTTGIWAGVAVYAIRTAATVAQAWRPVVPAPADSVEIPEDLVALAMAHRESWAQEDLLRVIREQYDELQDWNRVRAAMNIGRMAA